MGFSKRFPRSIEGSTYPIWDEIALSEKEEKEADKKAREDNLRIMEECLDDARQIIEKKKLNPDYQGNLVRIAVTLFDKRASHTAFYKEEMAKDRFDKAGKK